MKEGSSPAILSDIYSSENNLVIWRRDLPTGLVNYLSQVMANDSPIKFESAVSPDSVIDVLKGKFPIRERSHELVEDIQQLVDMFCCLFDAERVGMRLTVLERAMCPKFHVDKIPCRLVTTYQGQGTEWLAHRDADRTKLGMGSKGLPDDESGIYQQASQINQLTLGDVAVMKGEGWEGNENAGLIHRSPSVAANERRLLLTLDLID